MSFVLPIAMSTQDLALTVLPMAGSILLAFGVYQVIVESRHGERKKLAERLQGRRPLVQQRSVEEVLRRNAGEDDTSSISSVISKLKITPQIQTLLDQANVDWSASKMLMNQAAAAVVALFGLLVFKVDILLAVAAAAGVVFVPFIWLKARRARRMRRLTAQLPDVFEMMSQALRAGHSLASSLEVVYDQLPDPVGSEFGRVFHEQNLGVKIEDALLSMADRVDSMDVRFFVTAVLIQRQTGGDLAEVLDKIGSLIRDRIELFGLVQALTAEGRLSGWVLFALPFIVFFAVMGLNPGYGDVLMTDPTGKMLLFVAAGMQLMGLAMIRWIVNIKV